MIDEATVERWMRDANPIGDLADVDPDELAYAVAAVHMRRAAIMQAPTQHPTPTTPITPSPPRRRKAWAFAAAFILVIAAIGIAALAIRGGDDTPVTDEPIAPVTITTAPPTTSAPTPIDVHSLTWSRVPHDEAVFNPTGQDVMHDVIVGGPGFVAVGRSGSDGENSAVWVSEDGITWSLLPNGEPPLDGFAMFGVTAGGPGIVAVGFDFDPDGPGSTRVAGGAMWTSEDGFSWTKTVVGGENSQIFDVTPGGPGLVAVGTATGTVDHPYSPVSRAAVWTSVDGITWTRVPDDPDVFGELEGGWNRSMPAVAAGEPGLVAIEGGGPGAPEHAVWTSVDGLTWTLVPPADIPGDARMNDVIAGGPGFVAVGGTYADAAVWTSPDGLTWTLVPPSELPDGAPLHSVISVGSQLIAIGGTPFGYSEVWTSLDGETWTRAEKEIPGFGGVNAVAATEDGLIAVGTENGAAAVWIATQD
jgi:hypothetical protein